MAIVLKLIEPDSEKLIKLGKKSICVGRSSKADVKIFDPTSSGKHCELYVKDSKVIVKDLGSRNGTLVNGHPITETYLYIDDIIKIGKVQIVIDQKHLSPIEKAANSRMDDMGPMSTIDIKLNDGLTSKRDVKMITAIHNIEETNLTVDKKLDKLKKASPVVRPIEIKEKPNLIIRTLRAIVRLFNKDEEE